MNKALMISIQPQHAINILNGKKTLELRTWIPKGYVGWVYVYVVKSYPLLNYIDNDYKLMDRKNHTIFHNIGMYEFYNDDIHLNGKVVFRFWFDEYIELEHYDFWGESYYWKNTVISAFALEKATCVSSLEMEEYAKGKTLYAWHIKNLEIFDTPKELSEFESRTPYKNNDGRVVAWGHSPIINPPQKMQWVYAKELENDK